MSSSGEVVNVLHDSSTAAGGMKGVCAICLERQRAGRGHALFTADGSMHGPKLQLLQQAMLFLISQLGPHDRLSIITFSSQAHRVTPLRRMTKAGRQEAEGKVRGMVAGGGTNIAQGMLKALRVVEERRERNPVASIMLLSDGQDTATCSQKGFGYSSLNHPKQTYSRLLPSQMTRNKTSSSSQDSSSSSRRLVPVHTFGFGADHDAAALHAIAADTAGVFSFVEEPAGVTAAFAQCLGGLLSVVIQEAKISFAVGSDLPGWQIAAVHAGGYAYRVGEKERDGAVLLGDLYAEEERHVMLEVWRRRHVEDESRARDTSGAAQREISRRVG
ncbi:unnamed protein product [Closterium sp. Yama58-4]|nr:unnamed protein product [Closterium sp. Yama58-4]